MRAGSVSPGTETGTLRGADQVLSGKSLGGGQGHRPSGDGARMSPPRGARLLEAQREDVASPSRQRQDRVPQGGIGCAAAAAVASPAALRPQARAPRLLLRRVRGVGALRTSATGRVRRPAAPPDPQPPTPSGLQLPSRNSSASAPQLSSDQRAVPADAAAARATLLGRWNAGPVRGARNKPRAAARRRQGRGAGRAASSRPCAPGGRGGRGGLRPGPRARCHGNGKRKQTRRSRLPRPPALPHLPLRPAPHGLFTYTYLAGR